MWVSENGVMAAEHFLLWCDSSLPSVKFPSVFLISIRDGVTDSVDARYSGL
jgi:hypothetical protein